MRAAICHAAGPQAWARAAPHRLVDRGAPAPRLKNRGGGRAGPGKEDRDTAPAAPASFGKN